MTKNKEFMKNITRYATAEQYDQDFDNLDFPNVSYIDEGDEVRYMEEHPYMITGKSTATEPFTLKINNTSRNVTLDTATGDWKLNFKPYLPLRGLNGFAINKSNITEFKFPKNLDTSNVTSMDRMFNGCSTLTSIDVSNFNTANVTNMYSMFNGCSTLTSIDVSNFNTANVTDMKYMFSGCSNLTTLDVSKWNTENVTDMQYMFKGCSSLTSLDVSNFNTDKVTSMANMFYNCSSLTSLDITNFSTENLTNMYMQQMFSGCSKLTTLSLPQIGDGTKNVSTFLIFDGCSKLANIPSCGDIHNTVDFSPCPLTLDSAKVVLNALSTPYQGAQTLTFKSTTKALIKADADAMTLVEQKRAMGWTISL